MSQSLHVCKICGKKFETFKAVCGHQRIHSSKRNRMEEEEEDDEIWDLSSVSASDSEISSESETFDDRLRNVCKICGKRFETVRAVYGHMRIHSGKSNRTEDENVLQKIWGLEVSSEAQTLGSSLSLKEAEIEQHEMYEAALNFVILSERVYDLAAIRHLPPGDDFMDLDQLIPMKEKFSHFSELISHLGYETSSTRRDAVGEALCSPLTSKIQSNNSSYVCKICGKKFATSKAVCGHQRIHSGKSNRKEDYNGLQRMWGLEEQHEMNEAAMSLVMFSQRVYGFTAIENYPPVDDSMDIELKPAQEKILHCVESKLNFNELLSHSGFKDSSTCTGAFAQALPYPLRSSSYKCMTCDKSLGCSEALGGHQRLHR